MRLLLGFLALVSSLALASPDGAPWDHDGGPGRPDCTQCHFDSAPHRQSEALYLGGLPERITVGQRYEMSIRIEQPDLMTAGFLITAESGGDPAGEFLPIDNRTAANGAALRSTREGVRQEAPHKAHWTFRWTAPGRLDGPVIFYIAANASNDDASAFGDQIFLSAFEVQTKD